MMWSDDEALDEELLCLPRLVDCHYEMKLLTNKVKHYSSSSAASGRHQFSLQVELTKDKQRWIKHDAYHTNKVIVLTNKVIVLTNKVIL